jgi:hypothetical protein
VSTSTELSEAWEFGNDFFSGPRGYEISGLVGESDDRVGIADVDPLRVGEGIERDAERKVEASGECGNLLGSAVGAYAAEDEDLVAVGVGEENVAVGRGAKEARLAER